jgi:hypothetical protein
MDVSEVSQLSILLHANWIPGPGSFLEVSKIITHLTDPTEGAPAFHVIAPSLPGFTFSEATKKVLLPFLSPLS